MSKITRNSYTFIVVPTSFLTEDQITHINAIRVRTVPGDPRPHSAPPAPVAEWLAAHLERSDLPRAFVPVADAWAHFQRGCRHPISRQTFGRMANAYVRELGGRVGHLNRGGHVQRGYFGVALK